MTKLRIGTGVVAAVLFGFTTGAGAVAESEPEASAPEVEASAEEAAESAGVTGRVARSGFASAVVDREPVDTLSSLANDVESVAYFTELLDFEGSTVVHRWQFGGELMAEIPFRVGGPRWRVHSTKRLDPSWVGDWSVSVVAEGDVIATEHLSYTEAAGKAPATPASIE